MRCINLQKTMPPLSRAVRTVASKREIYPESRLGSTQRQAEGVQFGAIQCLIVPPEFLAGIDERFELLTAPGLVTSIANGQRLAADAAVKQLMLGLGADKGLHGVCAVHGSTFFRDCD